MRKLEIHGWNRQRVALWLGERRLLKFALRSTMFVIGIGAQIVATVNEAPIAGSVILAIAMACAWFLEIANHEAPVRPKGRDPLGLFDIWAWVWSWFWQPTGTGLVLRMRTVRLQSSVDRDWIRGKARGLEGVHGLINGRDCLAQRLVITSSNEQDLLLQCASSVGFVLDREAWQPSIVVEGAVQLELGEGDSRVSTESLVPLLTRWGMPPRILEGAAREVTIADGEGIEIASEARGDVAGGYREAQGVVLRGTPGAPIVVRKIR